MANTTLYPTADAAVVQGTPDTNYGDNVAVFVRSYTNSNMRAFLKFDISGLPVGAVISLATLKLSCFAVLNYLEGVSDIQARRVSDDSWIETGDGSITWTNQKAYGDVEDTKAPVVDTWIELDVTSWVQNEWTGDKTVSICLRVVQEDYDAVSRQSTYHSKEYNGDDPELYIEYTTGIKIPVAMHHYNRINKIIRG